MTGPRWCQDGGSGSGSDRTAVVAPAHQLLCKRKGRELEMDLKNHPPVLLGPWAPRSYRDSGPPQSSRAPPGLPGAGPCSAGGARGGRCAGPGRAGPSRAGRRELRRVRTGPRLGLRAGHRHRHRHPHRRRHLPASPGLRAGYRHRNPHRDQNPPGTPGTASGAAGPAPGPALAQGSGPALRATLGAAASRTPAPGPGPGLPNHAWGCEPDTGTRSRAGTASCSCPRCATLPRCPHGVTLPRVPAAVPARGDSGCCHHRQHERLLAQAGLLRGGEAPAQEEEETDRPLHDRGAHELRAPDTHWLWRHGCRRGAAHDWCCPGDEVQGRPGATVEQLPCVVAYSWLFQPKLELPDPPRWRRSRPRA